MILLTLGNRRSFSRLVRAVDGWAEDNPGVEIFGQIAETRYRPTNFPCTNYFATRQDRENLVGRTRILVGDAAADNLLLAIDRDIPAIVLPRSPIFGEDLTDAQSHLAKRASSHPLIRVAPDERSVSALLDDVHYGAPVAGSFEKKASNQFIRKLTAAIQDELRDEL